MSTESQYLAPTIETVRIVNVNLNDWSVDCISELGNKRFFDVQVMSPYFHFFNGEGIYVMPEVGCLAWICKPSSGKFAAPFILGFQAPFDSENVSYRSGRQNLNPGDIMMRTRDENFIILRRGGVVQIGATPATQRIYVPIQNLIRDFCENYQLFTFGGEMTWTTERDDQTTDGSAPTKYNLKVKQKANDPEHIAELTIGSHGEDDPLTMNLVIYNNGLEDREAQVTLKITNEGNISWDVQHNWVLRAAKDIILESLEEGFSLKTKKKVVIDSGDNYEVTSKKMINLSADNSIEIKSSSDVSIEGTKILCGGSGAVEPAVKGEQLAILLDSLITVVSALVCTASGAPIGAAANALSSMVSGIKSSTVFVK